MFFRINKKKSVERKREKKLPNTITLIELYYLTGFTNNKKNIMEMKKMGITLQETLYLLKQLGVENVNVNKLIETFFVTVDDANTQEQDLPELQTPPQPEEVGVYKTYILAQAAAKDKEKPVYDEKLKGFVLMK